jgi:hypothetical protein
LHPAVIVVKLNFNGFGLGRHLGGDVTRAYKYYTIKNGGIEDGIIIIRYPLFGFNIFSIGLVVAQKTGR